jgi:uncharacterized protein
MKEDHHWITSGSNRLSAIVHDARSERMVIMAHGFTGHKAEAAWIFTEAARRFAASGLNVLRFDFAGSGDSEGAFGEMSARTEIADLHAAIDWASRNGARRIGVLGLSMGGAVSICAVAERKDVAALVTWSAVPDFRIWILPGFPAQFWEAAAQNKPSQHGAFPLGANFLPDALKLDVPASYARIAIPKLIVEGTKDIPGFQAGNLLNHAQALEPKRRHLIPDGEHVFANPAHRQEAIRVSLEFFLEFL